jgi:glycosyltransferase involved in cell wall biosynthesis
LIALGSALGGIPESLDGGRTGVLFEPADPADLAEKIMALIDDPRRAADSAAAGRQHYARCFSKEAVTDRLLALYARVVADAEPARPAEPGTA